MQTLANYLQLTVVGCQRLLKERHDPRELELIRQILANAEAQSEACGKRRAGAGRARGDCYCLDVGLKDLGRGFGPSHRSASPSVKPSWRMRFTASSRVKSPFPPSCAA